MAEQEQKPAVEERRESIEFWLGVLFALAVEEKEANDARH